MEQLDPFLEFVSRPNMSDTILSRLSAHFLPLNLLQGGAGQSTLAPISGFLIHHRYPFWVSAGHLFESLQRVREVPDQRRRLLWSDGAKYGAPVSIDDLLARTFHIDESGIDLSFTMLRMLEMKWLRAGDQKAFITSSGWAPLDESDLLGYVLFGAPHSESSLVELQRECGGTRVRMSVGVTWLPVREVGRIQEDGEFWGVPGAFYGEICAPTEIDDRAFTIHGMSGGPIFAIGRSTEYRLAAVQSAKTKSDTPYIRGTPFGWVLDLIDRGLALLGLDDKGPAAR